MYLIAQKLGFADRMFKNIKVENNLPEARTSFVKSIAAVGRRDIAASRQSD